MRHRILSNLFGLFAGLGLGFALLLTTLALSAPLRANLISRFAPTNAPRVNDCELARVIRVIDGDTIVIESGARVRYLGVDTPETVNPNILPQFYGREATERNRELVEGQLVLLQRDVEDRDHYGRLLRYVFVGGTFVNAELVRQGYGYVSFVPPNSYYQEYFLELERQAKDARLGVWEEFFRMPTPIPTAGGTQ